MPKIKHYLTAFLNVNNKDILADYHSTLNLEIIEHTEIIIENC